MFVGATALFCIGFCFAGYAWQSEKLRQQKIPSLTEPLPTNGAARAKALEAIDEAITARSEDRLTGAYNALDRARTADPLAPSMDLLFAMLALKQGDAQSARLAVRSAIRKNQNLVDANVLLGVERWRARGPGNIETGTAAEEASRLFAEAVQADLFDSGAHFFWAEVLRGSGLEAEGHLHAVGALHRMNPWQSASIISAKAALAAEEFGQEFGAGVSTLPAQDIEIGDAAVKMRRAINDDAGKLPAAQNLRCRLTAAQARILASDSALSEARTLLSTDDAPSKAPDQ